jgi:HSP20 family protein
MFAEADWPLFNLRTLPEVSSAHAQTWLPNIDVFERDGKLVTRVDLPGLKKEDVSVEVTDGRLSISGERKATVEEKKDRLYRWEREYGHFCRVVPLPDRVAPADVQASFVDGVLEVTVPLPVKAESPVVTVPIADVPQKKTAA